MATEKLSTLLNALSGKSPVDIDKIPLLDSDGDFAFETATVAAMRAAIQTGPVTAVTDTAAPSGTNVGTTYTNDGDLDGVTVTLPSAAAGLQFSFCVQTNQTLTITAAADDSIQVSGLNSGTAGSISSSVIGSTITLRAINNTEWVAVSATGTWEVLLFINYGRRLIWGEMYCYQNASQIAIDVTDAYHPVRFLSAGVLKGITHTTHSTGAATAVSSGTNGVARVACNSHGLLVGQLVYLLNSTNYDGAYIVIAKDTNWFEVNKAYVQTRTFNWYKPNVLVIPTGGAGTYRISWNLSCVPAANNKAFKAKVTIGRGTSVVDCDNIAANNLFGVTTDYQPMSACGLVELQDGDRVCLQLKNQTDAADVTIRNANVNITRLG